IRGVSTTRYNVLVDLRKGLDKLDGPSRETMEQLVNRLEAAGSRYVPADAWIDSEGYLRRIRLAIPGYLGAGSSFSLTMDMYGFGVCAVHVDHGLRGAESDGDARHCRELMGAEIVPAHGEGTSEAELREVRYRLTQGHGLRATGHTASDQVETILYRIVASGTTKGIKVRREDGVVRPLLPLSRDETREYCRARGLSFGDDSSHPGTSRGLIRDEILPLLRRLHPGADANLLALGR